MKVLTRTLITITLSLVILGSFLIFSAKGMDLFISHLWKVLVALIGLIVFSSIPYTKYRDYSKYFIIFAVVLLIITLLFSPDVKGAARWINLKFIRFQPSELAKLLLMMHIAVLIEEKGKNITDYKNGLVYPLFWIFLITLLILIQPNVSTSLIVLFTSFVLLYIGGARLIHLGSIVGVASVFGGMAIMLFAHSRHRVITFVNSLVHGGSINMQVLQSKIALGSGGFLGLGIGMSRQSDLFLPEPHNDFIFSILGEELGFAGTLLILAAYLVIFLIGLIIAKKAKDKFGQLLAFGISFMVVTSAFLHAAVGMGVVPTTGITLPLVSFGGTSIIVFGISIGILINIGMQSKLKKVRVRKRK